MALFHITVVTKARRVLEVEAGNRKQALNKYSSDLLRSTEYATEVESECLEEDVIEVEEIGE